VAEVLRNTTPRKDGELSELGGEVRAIFAVWLPLEALLWIQYVIYFVKFGLTTRYLQVKIFIDF
jgi:hypothetical protein